METLTIRIDRYDPKEQDLRTEVRGLECEKEEIKGKGRGKMKCHAGI